MLAARRLPDLWRPGTLIRFVALAAAALVPLSENVSYGIRTVTALTAAAILLRATHRHRDGLRRARTLFAAALLIGAASGITSAVYLLAVGHPAPIGSASDWMYLMYAPLAVAAAFAVPRASAALGSRGAIVRALADGAVAAGSLWYVTVALFIGPAHVGADLTPLARGVTLAFPLLPAFVTAVILSAVPRVARPYRPFLLRAGAGVVLLGAGDIAVAVASWDGWYRPDSWIAVISEIGLLLFLDAAVTTRSAVSRGAARASDVEVDAASGPMAVAVPYAPLLLALGAACYQFGTDHGMGHDEFAPMIATGIALAVRHIAGARETGRLVTALAARERAARAQALSDPLTALANRTAFLQRLDAALTNPAAHQVAVAVVDLNDFKDINDTQGHGTGDEVLRRTAALLNGAVPAGCVARLGGDEFAVFEPLAADGGRALAVRIASAFEHPIRVGNRSFVVRASVGVVVDERPPGRSRPGDADQLLAHADVAMYQAKRGKHLQPVSTAVLTGRARADASVTIRLREQISHPDLSQFEVVYQPVVDLDAGGIVAAEALLRWHHPDVGDISPAVFIPLAEGVGTVNALDLHALTVALDDLADWADYADPNFVVGVNVSPRHLADPALTETTIDLLRARGLQTRQLSLEITEEAFADDMEAVVDTIAALRAEGLWVAVDDFGTGYSSLSYLRRFDANVVKIDREFVQACPAEPRTGALVRSVVAMAADLGLLCVAEGIETLEQLACIKASGCRFGQGFLLDAPMSAAQLGRLLATDHTYPVNVQSPVPVMPPSSTTVVPFRGVG